MFKEIYVDEVVAALEELREKGSYNYVGICCACDDYADFSIHIHHTCWDGWEHYSGDLSYPVPSGKEGVSAEFAFNEGTIEGVGLRSKYLSWGDNPYGNLRKSLLSYIINRLNDGSLIWHEQLGTISEKGVYCG